MSLFKRSKTTAKGFDWAGLGWLFLFFWYFSGITQLLILLSDTSGFTGFRQAFVMSAVWLAPMLLFPARTRRARGLDRRGAVGLLHGQPRLLLHLSARIFPERHLHHVRIERV